MVQSICVDSSPTLSSSVTTASSSVDLSCVPELLVCFLCLVETFVSFFVVVVVTISVFSFSFLLFFEIRLTIAPAIIEIIKKIPIINPTI